MISVMRPDGTESPEEVYLTGNANEEWKNSSIVLSLLSLSSRSKSTDWNMCSVF